MRLDKYISDNLGLTRSLAKKAIKNGEVIINGICCKQDSKQINIGDEIKFNNQIIEFKENIYIMLNKPNGYVCANKDNYNKTILDLIDIKNKNLSICGRLDIDTEGLIIITTDGNFIHKITSPKSNLVKKYYVEAINDFKDSDIKRIKDGVIIKLEDETYYKCLDASLEIIDSNKAYIYIKEGKFHQVKKMIMALDNKVVYLKRVAIGNLVLDDNLKIGEFRYLTEEEINWLK